MKGGNMRVLKRTHEGDKYRLQIQLRYIPGTGSPTSRTKSFTLIPHPGDKRLTIEILVMACINKLQEIYGGAVFED